MDDRSVGALIGGAFLVRSGARRAELASQRATEAMVRWELHRMGHSWTRRLTHAGAAASGLAGMALLLVSARRLARDADRLDREVVDHSMTT